MSVAPVADAEPSSRLAWADVARGIGISLVVYGHALRGQVNSGQDSSLWHAAQQDAVIYSFHMPLFFLLAGLFAHHGYRRSASKFASDKIVTLIYPYLLWSIISIFLSLASASQVNNPLSPDAIFDIWRSPVFQYWFLYSLLLCHIIGYIFHKSSLLILILGFVATVVGVVDAPPIISMTIPFFGFFAAGMLLSPRIAVLQNIRPHYLLLASLAGMVLIWLFLVFQTGFVEASLLDRCARFVVGMGGAVGVIAIALLIGQRAPWLALMGQGSMAIYVMHTIFSAPVRMAFRMAHIEANLLCLVVSTAVGVIFPLLVWQIAARWDATTWLGFGRTVKKTGLKKDGLKHG